jgi:hypothetical protein
MTGIRMEKTAVGIPKIEAAAGEVNAVPIFKVVPPLNNFQIVERRCQKHRRQNKEACLS